MKMKHIAFLSVSLLMSVQAMGVQTSENYGTWWGYGRAEKRQIIEMTKTLLGLSKAPKPDDTADALAIAICHAHSGGSRLAKYYNRNNY